MTSFEPGTLVQLKCGGPIMVVRNTVEPVQAADRHGVRKTYWHLPFIVPDHGVYVDWHDANGNPHSRVYQPEQLMRADQVTVVVDKFPYVDRHGRVMKDHRDTE